MNKLTAVKQIVKIRMDLVTYPSLFINLCYKSTLYTCHHLQFHKISLYLQCVFHSIRFKVNKRLGYSGIPFFLPLPMV